jgi:protoporphyrinogen oxidase
MKERKSWGIIGGGIMGMTLALRLAEKGDMVTVIEASSKPGGLTGSMEMNGIVWDRFYHVILLSDLNTRKIISEIGLENEFRWKETKTGFYSQGKLYSMSNILEFFKFPPINLFDKFRLGLTIFVASKIKNWERLEKKTVEEWLMWWSGKRVFEKIWLPLLKAKLGDNYKNTSAAFIWSTIQRMYAARKTGLKKEMFGYVSGGYDRINSCYAIHLEKLGVKFQLNSKVSQVSKKEYGKVQIIYGNGQMEEFDSVISTLSSQLSVEMTPALNEEEKKKHRQIRYLGIICPSILLKKAVSPFYVTNITDNVAPFTGVIEMTALIDVNELKGKHLIYLPKYVNPDDPLFNRNEDELKQYFLPPFLKMYPQLSEEDIVFFGVSKARVVFALPTLEYSKNLPSIKTSLDGYYIINNAQIINGTLNVNETIQVAEEKLKEIWNE